MATVAKVLRSFHVTPDQDTNLAIVSEQIGVPKSELVREGIDMVLHKYHNRVAVGEAAKQSAAVGDTARESVAAGATRKAQR